MKHGSNPMWYKGGGLPSQEGSGLKHYIMAPIETDLRLPSQEGSGLKRRRHHRESPDAGLPSQEGSGLKPSQCKKRDKASLVFPRKREVD